MMAEDVSANHAQQKLGFNLDIPFPSEREASIAMNSLSPDREPRKGGINKELVAVGNVLSVRWTADEARILRVSVGSFLDHLALILETMDAFGPPYLYKEEKMPTNITDTARGKGIRHCWSDVSFLRQWAPQNHGCVQLGRPSQNERRFV